MTEISHTFPVISSSGRMMPLSEGHGTEGPSAQLPPARSDAEGGR
eukprot:COSAG01_NODE_26616_length_708_cov_0.954023_3_plen_44_part_01